MESEEELLPWSQESKKKSKGISCLPEKTNLSRTARSKPKVEGREHLEIYLMIKEKERLEKVGEVAQKMYRQTARRLRQIEKEIFQAEKKVFSSQKSGLKAKGKVENPQKQTSQNSVQSMALDY